MLRVLPLALVLAFCSAATAAPVLVTSDNYQTPILPIVENFDDGNVNAPGLMTGETYQFVAGGVGGGLAIEPSVVLTSLDGLTNRTIFSFEFHEPWPTEVGFVTTQADIAGSVGIVTFPVNLGASLIAPFATNRFFRITDPNGIQALEIAMSSPVPGEPFFQIDDLQYVPEPSGAVLLGMGVAAFLIFGCRGHRDFRWLRASAATVLMLLLIRQAVGITTSDSPANHEVKAGTGRDGIVHIKADNGNFGTGTLLASGRHVWTASHIFEFPTNVTTGKVDFDLTTGKKTISATIAAQGVSGIDGHDLVILRLSEPAPISAEKYEPYRTFDEKGKIGQLVGYGQGGTGAAGATPGIPNPWIKREGSNKIDTDVGFGMLRSDFDSGNAVHDTLKTGDLGLGSAEACLAVYDSGGPLLIGNKVAGWAWQLEGAPGNSAFGQIMRHRRMGTYQTVHDQHVPPVVNSVTMSRQTIPFAAYAVPSGSGNQIRTVPVGGTNQIVVQFSEDVDTSATVTVDGKESNTSYPVTTSFLTPRFLQININAPIQRLANGVQTPGDKLTVTIANLKKPGPFGSNLDGDWVNPDNLGDTTQNNAKQALSAYPSGDGSPGTSFAFRIIVQPGDFDASNVVDLTDFGNLKANFGKTSGATYAQGDSDGDGDIDLTDFGAVDSNMGVNWKSW